LKEIEYYFKGALKQSAFSQEIFIPSVIFWLVKSCLDYFFIMFLPLQNSVYPFLIQKILEVIVNIIWLFLSNSIKPNFKSHSTFFSILTFVDKSKSIHLNIAQKINCNPILLQSKYYKNNPPSTQDLNINSYWFMKRKLFTKDWRYEKAVNIINLLNRGFSEFRLDILAIRITIIFPDWFDSFFEETNSIDISVWWVFLCRELKSLQFKDKNHNQFINLISKTKTYWGVYRKVKKSDKWLKRLLLKINPNSLSVLKESKA